MGHWNSRHRHLDRSLHNLLDYSLPHLPLLLQRFKPVQATHYSDSKVHQDLYNFRTRSLTTTSAALGSSTSPALSLTEPLAYLGNHQSCHYSHSWNGGCLLATVGFFTPAKQALGTTHCSDHSAWSEWYHSPSLSKGGSPPSLGHLS